MKPRSERDKRYEEKHKNERKAKNVIWGTSMPKETAEEIAAFLKKHGYLHLFKHGHSYRRNMCFNLGRYRHGKRCHTYQKNNSANLYP